MCRSLIEMEAVEVLEKEAEDMVKAAAKVEEEEAAEAEVAEEIKSASTILEEAVMSKTGTSTLPENTPT